MNINAMCPAHRLRVVLAAVFAAALLSACAGNPRKAGNAEEPALHVDYPEQLDGFTFQSVPHASHHASWGTQLNYGSGVFPELRLDVFAYHVGFSEDDERVVSEYEAFFPLEIGRAVEAGSYSAFTVHEQGRMPITVNGRTREGAWFHFQLERPDLDRTSITHFHYRPPFAVKIRASHPDTLEPFNFREHIADFARQIVPRLEIRRAQGCDIDVEVDPAAGEDALALALEDALLQSGRIGCQDYDSTRTAVDAMRAKRHYTPSGKHRSQP